jgi:hypothetical protein
VARSTRATGPGAARALGACWLLGLCITLAGCRGTRTLTDPTLEIRTAGGQELGVATDFGVLFLGRTARAGEVQIAAWFGDGPSVEASVIEPLGGGLYTAETQIRLPTVPMSFRTPQPGDELFVVGRRNGEPWEARVRVRADPRVEGLLLSVPGALRTDPEQIGAGVFVEEYEDGPRRLVALVSGRLVLRQGDGSVREYLTAVGPDDLWRLVARRQDLLNRRRWFYREDIL